MAEVSRIFNFNSVYTSVRCRAGVSAKTQYVRGITLQIHIFHRFGEYLTCGESLVCNYLVVVIVEYVAQTVVAHICELVIVGSKFRRIAYLIINLIIIGNSDKQYVISICIKCINYRLKISKSLINFCLNCVSICKNYLSVRNYLSNSVCVPVLIICSIKLFSSDCSYVELGEVSALSKSGDLIIQCLCSGINSFLSS